MGLSDTKKKYYFQICQGSGPARTLLHPQPAGQQSGVRPALGEMSTALLVRAAHSMPWGKKKTRSTYKAGSEESKDGSTRSWGQK